MQHQKHRKRLPTPPSIPPRNFQLPSMSKSIIIAIIILDQHDTFVSIAHNKQPRKYETSNLNAFNIDLFAIKF